MLPQGTCSPNAQGGHDQNAWRQLAPKLDILDPLLLEESRLNHLKWRVLPSSIWFHAGFFHKQYE